MSTDVYQLLTCRIPVHNTPECFWHWNLKAWKESNITEVFRKGFYKTNQGKRVETCYCLQVGARAWIATQDGQARAIIKKIDFANNRLGVIVTWVETDENGKNKLVENSRPVAIDAINTWRNPRRSPLS